MISKATDVGRQWHRVVFSYCTITVHNKTQSAKSSMQLEKQVSLSLLTNVDQQTAGFTASVKRRNGGSLFFQLKIQMAFELSKTL